MSARPTSTRSMRVALAAALVVLAACDGGPTSPDGRALPAQLAVAITLQAEAGAGGEGDAYDKANLVRIRLVQSEGPVLFDRTAAFSPQAESHVPVSVQVQADTPARLEITLLRDLSPLFTGSASLTLVPNEVVPAELTLVPVAGSISVPESLPTLASLGETLQLPGDVLFVTGDVASSLHLQWTSLTPEIVTVQTNGTTSSVVAVRSGVGLLKAAFPPFESDVVVAVDIVAASVDVQPPSSTLPIGETLQLTATPRDALGNPVPGTKLTWSSSEGGIASVDADGLVTGVAKGTATIRAAAGSVAGQATVDVVAPPPTVGTEPASAVGVFTARLHATVSAKGSPATAWFRYGTDPTLGTASETPHVSIGSGDSDQSVSADVSGLDPVTTYYFRAVASNDGGEKAGDIESFTTLPLAPPTVATLVPSVVTSTTARLVGTVDPRGITTLAHFEWGTDPSLATFTSTPDAEIAGGLPEQQVERTITGLLPEGQTYYYRVVATNDAGTARGAIRSFRTAPRPPSDFRASYDPPTVYMSWTDKSTSETYFSVERSGVSPTTGFAEVTTAPRGSEGPVYADDSAPFPAPTLYYRVRACNDFGCSEPSNTETVVVPAPQIRGQVFICYTPGTIDCFPLGPVKVTLVGSAGSTSTNTDASSGFYFFDPVAVGSYTVHVDDAPCSFVMRIGDRPVTVGWGDLVTVDFYSDYVYCGAPGRSSTSPAPRDPRGGTPPGRDGDEVPPAGP